MADSSGRSAMAARTRAACGSCVSARSAQAQISHIRPRRWLLTGAQVIAAIADRVPSTLRW
jgi:hypothetical protein